MKNQAETNDPLTPAPGDREGPDLSIVVPLYNEADNVYPLHAAISHSLQALGRSYEIVFVDDGSRDGTSWRLDDLYERDSHVTLVKLRKNFGQTPAMAAGFDAATGKIMVTMDGDLQNDPADISRLLYRLDQGHDVVCGWRRNRKDGRLLRLLPSWVANRLIAKITGVAIHDTGCTLKAYRSWVIASMALYSDMHRFIPALAAGAGAKVTEIGVRHHSRQYGISKYGISRVFRVVLDLLVIKMIITFASQPIRWFALISLPFFALGGVFFLLGLLRFNFLRMGLPSALERWDLGYMTVSIVLVMMASNLFLLGLLSELAVKASGFFRRETMAVGEAK